MRRCLFCDNQANSKEHVIPDWILQRVNVRDDMYQKLGDAPEVVLPNPELKIKAVCKTCNNGWMSHLEGTNVPVIGSLMQDVALSLDGLQQYYIAAWAVKMSMVGDFLAHRYRPLFFHQAEREQLRVAMNLPMRTTVWLARHSFPDHIGIWGTDSWSEDKSVHAFITTVLVGHLALQTVSLNCTERWSGIELTANTAKGPRPWAEMLTDVWPTKVSAQWPPNLSFKNSGAFALLRLVRRFSYGKDLLNEHAAAGAP